MKLKYKENFFENKDVKMRYFLIGKGKPLLFLHGGGVDALTYQKSLELLSKNYQVIAPDLPCFGGSSVPKELWGFSEFSDFFSKFISHLKLKEITLVGHSFGGGIALRLALKSKKVSKLILVDSMGIRFQDSLLKIIPLMSRKTAREFLILENKSASKVIVKSFFSGVFKNRSSLSRIYSILEKTIKQDFDLFNKIKQPTVILWGDKDEVIPFKLGEEMKKKIKNSKLICVKGNHDWCILKPEKFVDLIKKF